MFGDSRPSPTLIIRPIARLLPLGLLIVTLTAGCASQSSHRTLPPVGVPVRPAPAISERDRQLNEAMSQVLLAREQLRLGLPVEAETAWNRAIEILAPLAVDDSEITARLRAVIAERDRALLELEEENEARGADDGTDDATGDELADAGVEGSVDPEFDPSERRERIVILQAPEPEIDPTHVQEVEEAVQQVQESVTPDFAVETNPRVIAWLEAWTGNLRGFYAGSLERSGLYVDTLREIFAQEGLPKDLVYLAHVESGFKTSAYSRAAARGVFQFISETGRRYGLRIDRYIDERGDPFKAARASASYLRDLYAEFQDWKLALAAYNAGEGKIRRVIQQTGVRDFWDPRFQRLLRQETRNYVPAIFAATLIAKQPEKFGFTEVKPFEPIGFDLVEIPEATPLLALAKLLEVEAETLQSLNPELRRNHTPPVARYTLKVPVGSGAGFADKYATLTAADKAVQYETFHTVRRGETLSAIAKRYGVSSSALKRANGLRRNTVRTGATLRIPDGGSPSATAQSAPRRSSTQSAKAAPRPTAKPTYYRVRRGDTLSAIATRYGVEMAQIQSWNGMGSRTRVAIGERLRIAAPDAPQVVESRETPPPAASSRTHTVRAGETLWRIAQNYGISIDALLGANGLKKSSVIKPGMQLRIPGRSDQGASRGTEQPVAQRIHVVRRGETLASIAQRYRTSIDQLCRLNGLQRSATIHPGDTLNVTR